MVTSIATYLLKSERASEQVAIRSESLNRMALIEPVPTPPSTSPSKIVRPGGSARPTRPVAPAPPPPPPPPESAPPSESVQREDRGETITGDVPGPAVPKPTVKPKPSPTGELLYLKVTPTPQLFHQEEVEGSYPGRLEKGMTERVRVRLIRRLVESPRRIDETTDEGDRRGLTESIDPIPGRPLDLSLEEAKGPGYEAWIRCRLTSNSIEILPAAGIGQPWRRLDREPSLEWEWQIRTTSTTIRQEMEAVMEIEWRPSSRVERADRPVTSRLWQQRLDVTVIDPFLRAERVEVISPILGGSGALLMLIAALPLGHRRRERGEPAEQGLEGVEGVEARSDFKRSSRPSTVTSAPAANLAAPVEPGQDVVECSVFAPAQVPQGETVMIQVFAHLEESESEAARLAIGFDSTTSPRGVKTLSSRITRGTELTFDLALTKIGIPEPVQSLVWMGDTESVQFIVSIPEDFQTGNLAGSVTISQQTVPIGRISFLLRVVPAGTQLPNTPDGLPTEARAFHYTFISYASEDRDKVLARVQMLDQMGIRYFQDLLSLNPGQRWEKELYRNIDQCDLFLLFWSAAARKSEWVMREVDYAISRKGGNDDAPPEIRPVIIEGPPLVEPPEKLKHLHFNDRLIYLMSR